MRVIYRQTDAVRGSWTGTDGRWPRRRDRAARFRDPPHLPPIPLAKIAREHDHLTGKRQRAPRRRRGRSCSQGAGSSRMLDVDRSGGLGGARSASQVL